jgi:hypothetical protein
MGRAVCAVEMTSRIYEKSKQKTSEDRIGWNGIEEVVRRCTAYGANIL